MKHRTKDAVQPRKHNRYRLKVPVIFSWQDDEGGRQKAVGLTHDISLTGAFVLTATPPPLGSKVRLMGFVPRVRGAVQALRIYGQGLVTRVKRAHSSEAEGGFEMEGKPFVLRREKKYR